ncbi:DUF2851 family protein [Kiritimatiella glycovorans]|uniref:DUF2851 family protein n=1 Tax=Kiritimatiella glycovorans TaxID=1307763 RepID=A0A0G3EJW5_9BACT|nr:DUF2851 family protein [Kiritimatiella glycovorans]AKJ65085.1 hypothetical protein L21SP4_01848 [Kiritimatiella glycovorans]
MITPALHPDDAWPVTERHLQAIWYDRALRPDRLTTTAGVPVRVVHPGRWNLEAGPDFMDARVLIGDPPRPVAGDVEVHLRAADWARHGHDADPRYSKVRVHVTLHAGSAPRLPLPPGCEEIALASFLEEDLERICERIDVHSYPYLKLPSPTRCGELLSGRPPEFKSALLEAAGRQRMRRRIDRFTALRERHGAAETLYRELMAGLGYRVNKSAFRRVAEAVSLERLRAAGGPLAATAVLTGAAGLLPDPADPRLTEESRRRARILWDLWFVRKPVWTPPLPGRDDWCAASRRPANEPARRLAAAALWFGPSPGLEERLAAAPAADAGGFIRRAMEELTAPRDPFWERHWTWTSASRQAPTALIGPGRARTLLINSVIPWRLAGPEPRSECETCFRTMPAEPWNSTLRRAARLVLGPDHPSTLCASALARQGLIELHDRYCLPARGVCDQCRLPKAICEWEP